MSKRLRGSFASSLCYYKYLVNGIAADDDKGKPPTPADATRSLNFPPSPECRHYAGRASLAPAHVLGEDAAGRRRRRRGPGAHLRAVLHEWDGEGVSGRGALGVLEPRRAAG
jgi:hypothetical protein